MAASSRRDWLRAAARSVLQLGATPALLTACASFERAGRFVSAEGLVLPWQRVGSRHIVVVGALDDPAPENGGTSGNVGLIIGRSASVAVNGGSSAAHGRALLALARELGAAPVRAAVVTQPLPQQVMGLAAFDDAGLPICATDGTAQWIAARCGTCLERLRATLGAERMAGTRIVVPALRPPADGVWQVGDLLLRLPRVGHAAGPDDLVLHDAADGVSWAGALGEVGRLPDLRDADPLALAPAIEALADTPARWVLPDHGPPGPPSALRGAADYVRALEREVRRGLDDGKGLNELLRAVTLPAWSGWVGHDRWHRRNVQAMVLRLEGRALDEDVMPG